MISNDKRKGEFEHKLFKFIILVIVFVFFCLILGFIYVQFFSTSNPSAITNYVFEINSNRYEFLNQLDRTYYQNINHNLPQCEINKFYTNHITQHLPCIIKYTNTTNEHQLFIQNIFKAIESSNKSEISLVPFVNVFLKFLTLKIGGEIQNMQIPYSDSKSKFFVSKGENRKIIISPISQINQLKPTKNETYQDFNSLYSGIDLFSLNNESTIIKFEVTLENGDLLYVPEYFFIQSKDAISQEDNLIVYEYSTSNKLLEITFKALFDEHIEQISDDY